jgi:hypothetical protein
VLDMAVGGGGGHGWVGWFLFLIQTGGSTARWLWLRPPRVAGESRWWSWSGRGAKNP